MHIRIFVEDHSGKIALQHILDNSLDSGLTFEIMAWRGIGRLPSNLLADADPRKRTLLDKLPALLRASGRQFSQYEAVVIVIVDLDNRNYENFLQELLSVLATCNPKPEAFFALAVEEGEAWLLGDREAVNHAYPQAKRSILDAYRQDSICGTWEILADAVHPGGSAALKKRGVPYSVVGTAKCEWADRIAKHIKPERNQSASFQYFYNIIDSITMTDSDVENSL